MQSIINILKVNDSRSGVSAKNGKPYTMQDAECLLMTADGKVDQVGVLQVPRDMIGKLVPGYYTCTFGLQANLASRRIEAVATNFTPFDPKTLTASRS